MSAVSPAADAQLHAELWYGADADGGAMQLLGTADGAAPANAITHLEPWIDAMFCTSAELAGGALRITLRESAGSNSLGVITAELRIP